MKYSKKVSKQLHNFKRNHRQKSSFNISKYLIDFTGALLFVGSYIGGANLLHVIIK